MKIKQTIKVIVIGLAATIGYTGLIGSTSYAAGSCGGVTTSIINCSQTGACSDGTNPTEGAKPSGSDSAAIAKAEADYKTKYGHSYGLCKGDIAPGVETSGVWGLLLMVINILTAGIGVAAVAGIIYGSVMYASAGGNPENVKKARTIITNVVIGVVAYALMYALLNFITPGGLFN